MSSLYPDPKSTRLDADRPLILGLPVREYRTDNPFSQRLQSACWREATKQLRDAPLSPFISISVHVRERHCMACAQNSKLDRPWPPAD